MSEEEAEELERLASEIHLLLENHLMQVGMAALLLVMDHLLDEILGHHPPADIAEHFHEFQAIVEQQIYCLGMKRRPTG